MVVSYQDKLDAEANLASAQHEIDLQVAKAKRRQALIASIDSTIASLGLDKQTAAPDLRQEQASERSEATQKTRRSKQQAHSMYALPQLVKKKPERIQRYTNQEKMSEALPEIRQTKSSCDVIRPERPSLNDEIAKKPRPRRKSMNSSQLDKGKRMRRKSLTRIPSASSDRDASEETGNERKLRVQAKTYTILQEQWLATGTFHLLAANALLYKALSRFRLAKQQLKAARIIQRYWKRHNLHIRRMNLVAKVITANSFNLRLIINRRRRAQGAVLLRKFLVHHVHFERIVRVMKLFRWRIIQLQRLFKGFIACRKARCKALELLWVRTEIKHNMQIQQKMNKKYGKKTAVLTQETLGIDDKNHVNLSHARQRLINLFAKYERTRRTGTRNRNVVFTYDTKLRRQYIRDILNRKRAEFIASELQIQREEQSKLWARQHGVQTYTLRDIKKMVLPGSLSPEKSSHNRNMSAPIGWSILRLYTAVSEDEMKRLILRAMIQTQEQSLQASTSPSTLELDLPSVEEELPIAKVAESSNQTDDTRVEY